MAAVVDSTLLERTFSATGSEETMTEKYLVSGTIDPIVATLAPGIPTVGTVYVTDAAAVSNMYVQEYKANVQER